MISAMECLLEAENYMTAAQAAVDPDARAEYLRRSVCYRNLALDLMQRGPGEHTAFSLMGKDDPCCSDCASERQRRVG
jgi:hypothetical protein